MRFIYKNIVHELCILAPAKAFANISQGHIATFQNNCSGLTR